jgi:hypothetical protein
MPIIASFTLDLTIKTQENIISPDGGVSPSLPFVIVDCVVVYQHLMKQMCSFAIGEHFYFFRLEKVNQLKLQNK